MKESVVEAYLRDQVKAHGGKAYKFISPGNAGVPDRLIVWPGGWVDFVELKATGQKCTALQEAQIAKLRGLGCTVNVVDSIAGVDELIRKAKRS